MTVNLTRIYTKRGDSGDTDLGDMSRVSKLHARVEAYGTVDELNAAIGVALLQPGLPDAFAASLSRVQNDLLDVGADLSVPAASGEQSGGRERLRIGSDYTDWLEGVIDEVNATLAPLHSFVIPGGSHAAAHMHVARTVCRRAERRALAVGDEVNPEVVRYLNRLSDMLFVLSRAANSEAGEAAEEPLWAPGDHASGTRESGAGSRPARGEKSSGERG